MILSAAVAAMGACAFKDPPPPAAWALTGEPLNVKPAPAEETARKQAQLDEARAALAANPDDLDAIIWVGRREAYLGLYRKAIATFTEGLAKHPDSPELLRHRGHRFITVREFDNAIADLSRAAEIIKSQPDAIEPDGQPNDKNVPLSTLHSNIWYHLGLAHYLKGEYQQALAAYQHRVDLAANDDQLVSTTYWRYLCFKKLGRHDEARAAVDPAIIHESLNILENKSYFTALLTVRGLEHPRVKIITPLTTGVSVPATEYALAVYELTGGRTQTAKAGFDRVRELADWPNFVHIAAEADLARMKR